MECGIGLARLGGVALLQLLRITATAAPVNAKATTHATRPRDPPYFSLMLRISNPGEIHIDGPTGSVWLPA